MTESGQAWADLGPFFACLGGYVGPAWTGGTPVLASSSTSASPCCAARPAGPRNGRDQGSAEGFLGSGGIVVVGLGRVAEAAVAAHDGHGHFDQTGEIARQMTYVRPAAVFVVGEVAHIVETVLDVPVVAHQGEQLLVTTGSWLDEKPVRLSGRDRSQSYHAAHTTGRCRTRDRLRAARRESRIVVYADQLIELSEIIEALVFG